MTFQEFLENEGYETRSYSGRGMFGKQCLAVTVSEPIKAAWEIARQMQVAYTERDHFKAAHPPKSDSMGLSYVLYWPSEEYIESNKQGEQNEDDNR